MRINYKRQVIFIFIILSLASLLRLYHLGAKVIWYDEADSVSSATRNIAFYQDKEVVYKPLYFILLRMWIKLFGVSPFCLRLLSVFFGVLSVYWIYLLGREMFGEKTGLTAALFLSISPFHIYHSQQVRHFTLITFLAIVSFYYLFLYIRHRKIGYLVMNLLFNILTVATHPFGIFIIISQMLIVFLEKDKYYRNWLVLSGLMLSLYLLMVFMFQFGMFKEMSRWIPVPNLASLKDLLSVFIMGGSNFGRGLYSMHEEMYEEFGFLRIIGILSIIAGVFVLLRGVYLLINKKTAGNIVLIWIFLPIILAYIVSHCLITIFAVKHFMIILPAFYILMAYVCASIKNRNILVLGCVFILSIMIFPLFPMYGSDLNMNWRKCVRFVNENVKSGDTFVLAPRDEIVTFFYYFRQRNRSFLSDISYWGKLSNGVPHSIFLEGSHRFILIKGRHNYEIGGVNELCEDFLKKLPLISGVKDRRIWVIANDWVIKDDLDFMIDALKNKGYNVLMKQDRGGVHAALLVYEKL